MLYSFKLPVKNLGFKELKKGMKIRFAMLVNYNDGISRAGYLHWGEGIAMNKASSEYCIIELTE